MWSSIEKRVLFTTLDVLKVQVHFVPEIWRRNALKSTPFPMDRTSQNFCSELFQGTKTCRLNYRYYQQEKRSEIRLKRLCCRKWKLGFDRLLSLTSLQEWLTVHITKLQCIESIVFPSVGLEVSFLQTVSWYTNHFLDFKQALSPNITTFYMG